MNVDTSRFLPVDLQPGMSVYIGLTLKEVYVNPEWPAHQMFGLLNLLTIALTGGIDSGSLELYVVSDNMLVLRRPTPDTVSILSPSDLIHFRRIYGEEAKTNLEKLKARVEVEVSRFFLHDDQTGVSTRCNNWNKSVPWVSVSKVYDSVNRVFNGDKIDPSLLKPEELALTRQAFIALLASHNLKRRDTDCEPSCDMARVTVHWQEFDEETQKALAKRLRRSDDSLMRTDWKVVNENATTWLDSSITEVPLNDGLQLLKNLPALLRSKATYKRT